MSFLFGGMALATTGMIAYNDINKKRIALRKQKKEFKRKFQQFMEAINKENKLEQTYEMLEYIPKNYGCDTIISIPIGYNTGDLMKLTPSLEMYYNANIIIEPSKTKTSAYMRVHYVHTDIKFEDDIKFRWYKCMNNIKEARNNVDETFNIESITDIKDFSDNKCGYLINISIPSGLNYQTLLSNTGVVEQAFGCKLYGKYDSKTKNLVYRAITKPMDDKYPFKPHKLSNPYELFIGYAYDYTPIIVDMRYLVHGCISGRTGVGKSVELQVILTNHIYWFSSKQFHLYLAQLSSKSDVNVFKDVEQCRYCANNIEETYKLLRHLKKEMDRRNRLFEKCGEEKNKVVLNIYKYNSLNPKKTLPEIIFYSDEFYCYQPSAEDKPNVKDYKEKCLALLMNIFTEGRNVGIHVLCALQRPDVTSLSPLMKSQMGLRVCFRQENEASAKTVLDGVESPVKLCELEKREAFVVCEDNNLMKTLYLPEDEILKFIEKRIDKSHKNYIKIEDDEDETRNNDKKDGKKDDKKEDKKEGNKKENPKQRKRHDDYIKKQQEKNKQNKQQLPSCVIKK